MWFTNVTCCYVRVAMVLCNIVRKSQDMPRVTSCRFVQGCNFVHLEFPGLWFFHYAIKKELITRAIKQATMSIIFSVRGRVSCRFQSMQTIIFDYECDSVSSMAVKFRNHAAAFQHSLPILITDGEKIILLYVTFTYFSSQCQNACKFPYCGRRPARWLFCSILSRLKSLTVTRYTNSLKGA